MRATKETKKKFEAVLRENGYGNMRELANAAGLNYENLTRVIGGKQGEGSVLVKISRFLGIPYLELRQRCGFCGVDGEEAIEELNKEFRAQGATVVGNSNVVNSKITNSKISALADLSGLDTGALNKVLPMMAELDALKRENEMMGRLIEEKEKRISQLEEDKKFLRGLLENR